MVRQRFLERMKEQCKIGKFWHRGNIGRRGSADETYAVGKDIWKSKTGFGNGIVVSSQFR